MGSLKPGVCVLISRYDGILYDLGPSLMDCTSRLIQIYIYTQGILVYRLKDAVVLVSIPFTHHLPSSTQLTWSLRSEAAPAVAFSPVTPCTRPYQASSQKPAAAVQPPRWYTHMRCHPDGPSGAAPGDHQFICLGVKDRLKTKKKKKKEKKKNSPTNPPNSAPHSPHPHAPRTSSPPQSQPSC